MRFEAAWCWLLLLPLLAYAAWVWRQSYAQLSRRARWTSLALRVLIMVLLIAALSRPSISVNSDNEHLVILLDVSKSVSAENLDAALEQADQVLKQAAERNSRPRYSVIAFGQGAELLASSAESWTGWEQDTREKLRYRTTLPELYGERTKIISQGENGTNGDVAGDGNSDDDTLHSVENRIADIERFRDAVAGNYTNAEQALRLALNCGSNDQRRSVVLFTDANFNRGQWQSTAIDAAARNEKLHTVILDRPSPPEVAAVDLSLPSTVRVDQGFTAELRVAATIDTTADLHLFKDGVLQTQQSIELRKGSHTIPLPGLYFRDKGFHNIEAVLRPRDDTDIGNNAVRAMVVVPGEARVLYVDGDLNQIHYLKTALELEGMNVEARSATGVPDSLSELLSFDAFVLCNVPADRLSLRQMQMVRTYVQDFGGGFVMLGGDESFGLGGYYNTPIEEVLPVRMPIQKDMNRPSLALILVIDKSGSMAGVKIQLAKRAAMATAEAINPKDLIGVIGFDGEARVLLELTAAADRGTIASHVAALDAGGGTFLYPAMEQARNRLLESIARRRHVIVLSDGATQGFGYEDLASMMSADGITISTIGIGEGADMRLMEAIAGAGGGRTYFTNDFHSIPQIFTREALRASKSMLVERMVLPVVIGDDECLNEIDPDELPMLTGYVATTPKPVGSVIIASDSGDPLLAKWRFGLGRSVAFTSEPKPRWAEDWVDWDNFAKFWSQLIRSVTGQDLARRTFVECSHQVVEGELVLSADVRAADGRFLDDVAMTLSTVDENGRVQDVPIRHRGPGLYEARVGEPKFDVDRQFLWRTADDGEEEQTTPYGTVTSYSPELTAFGPDNATVKALQALNLGDVMSVDSVRIEPNKRVVQRWITIAPGLLIAALLLAPVDILVRRIG